MLVAAIVLMPNVPEVPVSVKVSKVFGVASPSWIVSVPFVPAVAKVIFGAAFENASADVPVNVWPAKVGLETVSMSCGRDKVTAPVAADAITW